MRILPETSQRGSCRHTGFLLAAIVMIGLWGVRSSPASAAASSDPQEGTQNIGTEPGVAVLSSDAEVKVRQVEIESVIFRRGDRLPQGRRVVGYPAVVETTAHYTIEASSQPGVLRLLSYPDFFANEPLQIPERQRAQYLSGPFRPTSTHVLEATLDGVDVQVGRFGNRQDLVIELPASGEARTLALRVQVPLPNQKWPLGCTNGRCMLASGGAPLVSAPAQGGLWRDPEGRVVAPTVWKVKSVRFARPRRCRAGRRSEKNCDRDELVVVDGDVDQSSHISYPVVIWGTPWHHHEFWHHGVRVEILTIDSRTKNRYPKEPLLGFQPDLAGHMESISRDIIELVDADLPAKIPAIRRLVMVQGPLRAELAQAHGGLLVVSDAALEVVPLPRFQRFHRHALARRLAELFATHFLSTAQDPSTSLWLSEMLALRWQEGWLVRQAARDEDLRDILAGFTFFPAVDRLLYAGTNTFGDAYFRGVEDAPALRAHPLHFANDLPNGRRIHEKLRDLLSPEQLAEFYKSVLAHPELPPQELAQQAYGRKLGWFFDQWLGPYPEVDYAVSGIENKLRDDGLWDSTVSIRRVGERGLVEPVQVFGRRSDGEEVYLVWNGEADPGQPLRAQSAVAEHSWTVVGESPVVTAWLDPRSRLHEVSMIPSRSWERVAATDPLFNNRKPPLRRFIYTGVGVEIAASEIAAAQTRVARLNAIEGYAYFQGGLRRDLRRSGSVYLSKGRESIVAGGGGMSFHFGGKTMPNRRRARLYVGGAVDWLSDRGLDPIGGLRISQTISVSDDTRTDYYRPEKGHDLWLSVGSSQVLRKPSVGSDNYSFSARGGWSENWRLFHGHTIVSRLEFALTQPIASKTEFRSLQRMGGIEGLSAYQADEVFARGVLLVQGEYRHILLQNLRGGLAGMGWLRDIGGTFLVGAASASHCESFRGWIGSGSSWYSEIGYGLSAMIDVFGLSPQLIRVDVAVPLVRRDRTCLNRQFPDYLAERQGLDPAQVGSLLPPYSLSVTFRQSY